MVSLARKALALPLIGSGKLVLFWILTTVTVGEEGSRTVSRIAGDAESADSAVAATERGKASRVQRKTARKMKRCMSLL